MPSSSLSIYGSGVTPVVYDLVNTSDGVAVYRDMTTSLAAPTTLEFRYKVGAPGAKANDRLSVIHQICTVNSETGLVSKGTARFDVSLPRDSSFGSSPRDALLAILAGWLVNATEAIDDTNYPLVSNAQLP